jgi:phosphoribosyl-AMP cyclohydrolase
MRETQPDVIHFDADGLIPAVVQDVESGDVLMLAFMNAEALRLTRATGRAHYWSRSRQQLWRKGETSGNEQSVAEIRVNCEQNSLLLVVRQTGAVCHDGYPTCYYRRLEPDDTLTLVRERAFNPADVYGAPLAAAADDDPQAEATRLQYGAYAFLRDHDLSAVSGTSRRLRSVDGDVTPRIADELGELAGVLVGDHRHDDRASDLRLEASQVIYWVLLHALRHGVTWRQLRPDRALTSAEEEMVPATAARILRAEAIGWATAPDGTADVAAQAHATLALVSQACRTGGIDPLTPVQEDLEDLRSRPYLAPYFAPAE